MKKLIAVVLLSLSSAVFATGYFTGQQTNGMHRICYYKTPTGTVVITIKITQICPVTI